ncbi:pitrilysin family protein [Devosia sp. ZB163]|uniref:M16 family metallopeptidase n=1 Tax=Devosia sp. ZB163 TaxID=3025938 RepID=UPI00235F0F6B|nr:pitrilysin family protein [Devosia sp. ZB163]MDC9825739.1 pitrilysin family protein [Devosia sp. ZB163]
MHFIRLLLATASFVLVSTSLSIADDELKVVHYRLENGLEVVLAPDHKVPKVALSLIYRVGGMNEPAGRSGFAHLFEHLMFSGTKNYPDIDRTYSELGLSNNAFTSEDRTIYLADGLSSALPVLLSVEADRMANLGREVDQAEFDVERDVVKNEMRQTVLDSAGQSGMLALRSALFPAPHPYAKAVIGSIADLDAAQLGDVKAFFNAYYVPNNAILSVAGDFDVDATRALIADTFGRVPRGGDVMVPAASVPVAPVARIEATDRVASPMVMLGIAGPSVETKESRALTIAADVLGNYEYGVLRRRLVETGLAVQASAGWENGRLGGRFTVSATAAPGVAIDTLEAELRRVILDFAATDMVPEDMERARRLMLLSRGVATEAALGKAGALGTTLDLFGDTELVLQDDPLLLELTPEQVSATFRDVVRPEAMSVLTMLPGQPGDYPAVLKDSSGVPQPIAAADRPAVEVPMLAPDVPGKGKLPAMETATLSNGIEVVHYRTPGAPMALVAASVTGGSGNDEPGREGLAEAMATLMTRGAGERDFEAFSKAAKDIGADVSGFIDTRRSTVLLSVAAEAFEPATKLLADAVRAPRFEPAEWATLKAELQQGLMYRQLDPAASAYYELERLMFPLEPGRPALQSSVASIEGVTVDDIRGAYEKRFTPSTMTLFSVGTQSLEEVRASLEAAFGDWVGGEAGDTPVTFPSAVFPEEPGIYVAPSADTSQAVIYVARPAPGFDEPGFTEASTVARLFAGESSSRLSLVLREAKGYSYGVSSGVWSSMRTGGVMLVNTSVQADKVGASLAEILKGFDELATVPVTEVELTSTIMASANASAGTAETSSGVAGLVLGAAGKDMTAAEFSSRLEDFVSLDPSEVQRAAKAMSSTDRAIIMIGGDPQSILPQLAEIGIEDVTVLSAPAP